MTAEEIAQIAALITATLHRESDAATSDKISRLTTIVDTLASSVVAHDNQIEGLITLAEKHGQQIAAVNQQISDLSREWQAYLRRIPPQ